MSAEADREPMVVGRPGETDEEARLRASINRHAASFMNALDAASRYREANAKVKRSRHISRSKLQEAALFAMEAFHLSKAPDE